MATRRRSQRRSWGTLRTMRNGNLQASYIADDGQRYYAPRTFDAAIDAEGWLAKERKLIDLGEWTPPESRTQAQAVAMITVREYSEQWLARRGADLTPLTPKTAALYRQLLDGRILPVLGDLLMREVTPKLVGVWWAGLDPNTKTRNAQAYQLLKTLFGRACADRPPVVAENPCQIKDAGKAPPPRKVEALTPAELEIVAEEAPEHYRAAVPVAAWCGLRLGELIELRRKDVVVTADRTVLKIRRAATRVDNKIVVGTTKTEAGLRDVTVPPHVAEILKEHMRANTGRGPESFVFTTTRGDRLSQTALTKSVKKGFEKVGKPTMRVHDLRHVGATLAAQAGATTKELMSRLGHKTSDMALRYQIAAADRDAVIADRLSDLAGWTPPEK